MPDPVTCPNCAARLGLETRAMNEMECGREDPAPLAEAWANG